MCGYRSKLFITEEGALDMVNKDKPKLIIIEGAQGCGKSTISRILREKMTSTQLLSMSGNKDLSQGGKDKSFIQHSRTYSYIFDLRNADLNMILERSHLSETIYARLGYKPYSFDEANDFILEYHLNDTLSKFYDISIFILVADEREYEKRLVRDKGSYVGFCVEGSMKQQDEYLMELKNIEEKYPNIDCYVVDTIGYEAEEIADFIIKTIE